MSRRPLEVSLQPAADISNEHSSRSGTWSRKCKVQELMNIASFGLHIFLISLVSILTLATATNAAEANAIPPA